MRSAADPQAFVAAPCGTYFAGPSFLVWCESPTLAGSVHWGRPGWSEIEPFLELLEFRRSPCLRPPIDFVADARDTQAPDPEVFAKVLAHIAPSIGEIVRLVRRHAFVHGPGLAGAAIAGFMPMAGGTHDWRLFGSSESAFEWLGEIDTGARVRELSEACRQRPPATNALRAHLEAQRKGSLARLTLGAAARALGVSARSLQRLLLAERTSFRAELAAARVRAARPMLRAGAKLEGIASELGYSSGAAFARAYRRATGQLPTER